ncbi:hypothetical protein ACIQWL_42590 [Streptomyces mirabilis]|uniref:hypothetical protein n=1 Tax=Streptomyces mirabilis TaxID=68239 RepID=UPI003406EDC8
MPEPVDPSARWKPTSMPFAPAFNACWCVATWTRTWAGITCRAAFTRAPLAAGAGPTHTGRPAAFTGLETGTTEPDCVPAAARRGAAALGLDDAFDLEEADALGLDGAEAFGAPDLTAVVCVRATVLVPAFGHAGACGLYRPSVL